MQDRLTLVRQFENDVNVGITFVQKIDSVGHNIIAEVYYQGGALIGVVNASGTSTTAGSAGESKTVYCDFSSIAVGTNYSIVFRTEEAGQLAQAALVVFAADGLSTDALSGLVPTMDLSAFYQPLDDELTAIAAIPPANGIILVGDGTTWQGLSSLPAGSVSVDNAGFVVLSETDAQSLWDEIDATINGYLVISNNLSDLADAATARNNLGLLSMALQNSDSVNITGGIISVAAITAPTISGGDITLTKNIASIQKLVTLINTNSIGGVQQDFETDRGSNDKYIIAYGSTHSLQPDELSIKNVSGDITFYTATLERGGVLASGAWSTNGNSFTAGIITGTDGSFSNNLGVGTTTPSEALEVVGNGLFSGSLTAGAISGTTGSFSGAISGPTGTFSGDVTLSGATASTLAYFDAAKKLKSIADGTANQYLKTDGAGTFAFADAMTNSTSRTERTISSGVIDLTGLSDFVYTVDTESGASEDDLVTITADDDTFFILTGESSARDVHLKDIDGNLRLACGDFSLDVPSKWIVLYADSDGFVYEVARSTQGHSQRVNSQTSNSTLSPGISVYIYHEFTALATGLTINNPTGMAHGGHKLYLRIKDNGTSQALTWGSEFRGISEYDLPTNTHAGKWMYFEFTYNDTDTKWDMIYCSHKAQYAELYLSAYSGDISTDTNVMRWVAPFDGRFDDIPVCLLKTAPTGAAFQVDMNLTGTGSVLSTKLTVDATEKTSETAATPAVLSDYEFSEGDEFTFDIDQVGSTVTGEGAYIRLKFTKS